MRLKNFQLKPDTETLDRLKALGAGPIRNALTLEQLLRRSDVFFDDLARFDPELSQTREEVAMEVETRIKYEGYVERQERQVEKTKRMETVRLPEEMDYGAVHGLTNEVREKLGRIRPISLGQASRISGVTPAAIMAIQVHLKAIRGLRNLGI